MSHSSAKENFQLLNEEAYEKIVVHNDGNCLWMVPFVFTTTCKIDVTHFPFDEQVCEFEIGSWAYTGAYLNILYKGQKGDLSQYSQNSAWEVLGMQITVPFSILLKLQEILVCNSLILILPKPAYCLS